MVRSVQVGAEFFEYELVRKKVRNINLHLRADGTLWVSAPKRVAAGQIDALVQRRSGWIKNARERLARRLPITEDRWTDADCLRAFLPVCERLYPLVAEEIGEMPRVRVKWMKSRWGVCDTRKRVITLNKLLIDRPLPALEYVVLHELVHLKHRDHQRGFHEMMGRLMPDYRARRRLLEWPEQAAGQEE